MTKGLTTMRFLYGGFQGGPGAVGLLALRLVAGSAMMFHGWGKIQNPMGWMGPDAKVPGILQFLAAFSEFGGGLAWILGLLTPIAAFGILCTMAVATFMVHIPAGHPFVGKPGEPSYEPALGYLAIALALMLVGPGRLSLDYILFGKPRAPKAATPDATLA
ncbi:DoxX family protein [Tundrisphaera sp. TA3]|uniref:DoxX family protein n=1 Tax=Tundrisphaera sp. TA3 TaxID=3435775 RepID=UPI003EBF0AEF